MNPFAMQFALNFTTMVWLFVIHFNNQKPVIVPKCYSSFQTKQLLLSLGDSSRLCSMYTNKE